MFLQLQERGKSAGGAGLIKKGRAALSAPRATKAVFSEIDYAENRQKGEKKRRKTVYRGRR